MEATQLTLIDFERYRQAFESWGKTFSLRRLRLQANFNVSSIPKIMHKCIFQIENKDDRLLIIVIFFPPRPEVLQFKRWQCLPFILFSLATQWHTWPVNNSVSPHTIIISLIQQVLQHLNASYFTGVGLIRARRVETMIGTLA